MAGTTLPALLHDLIFADKVDLTDPNMAGVVGSVWCGAEYPERCLDPYYWTDIFRDNGYINDGVLAERPMTPITLYRGCCSDRKLGMSWTSDLEVARRFAYDGLRGRRAGHVYIFDEACGWDLLAYIGEKIGRNESEYVVDWEVLEMHEDEIRLFETKRA
ncbi:hypothetical protein [Mycobacterium riyadhense]|uniref:hypothetical protein n=1 Tax=Mycobacterium riyadhense TaxID=486698 RepID=UPI0019511AF6|nr:hypothetical protein [Mycobacterium riyadhense]